MAKHYGLKHLAVPSAGNAAGALAAYAAAAGIAAPPLHAARTSPSPITSKASSTEQTCHMVDGLISDCARLVAAEIKSQKAKPISASRRDLVRHLDTQRALPRRGQEDHGLTSSSSSSIGPTPTLSSTPTGGGVGLIGMWKAFDEMEQLGWIEQGMQAAQDVRSSSLRLCPSCPSVRRRTNPPASSSKTLPLFAAGLRVPQALWRLHHPRHSPRTQAAKPSLLTTEAILASILDYAKHEGIFLSPEGAAATAAYDQLLATGELTPTDRVVLFNTGAGLKYTDMTAEAMHLRRPRFTAHQPPRRWHHHPAIEGYRMSR